jgi:hypothetical protein
VAARKRRVAVNARTARPRFGRGTARSPRTHASLGIDREEAHRDPGHEPACGADAPPLRGSSYPKLPRALQFFKGNIGLHHVHHLNARIPNHNLQRAHDENAVFHQVPTLSSRDGLHSVRLKLWDDEHGKLFTFAQARAKRPCGVAGAPPSGRPLKASSPASNDPARGASPAARPRVPLEVCEPVAGPVRCVPRSPFGHR